MISFAYKSKLWSVFSRDSFPLFLHTAWRSGNDWMTAVHFQYLKKLLNMCLAIDGGSWLSHWGCQPHQLCRTCYVSAQLLPAYWMDISQNIIRRQEEEATNSLRCGPGNGESITSVMLYWSHNMYTQ